MVADTFNIAQNYLEHSKDLMDASGKAIGNLNKSNSTGEPGSGLTSGNQVFISEEGRKMVDKTYDQMVNLTEIRTLSQQLLDQKNVGTVAVRRTARNAVETDRHSRT